MESKRDKNQLLMQALKERLMQRRLEQRPDPMGEQPTEDSEYGDRYEDSMGPQMREPADDMDGDFYDVIKKFSGEQEAQQQAEQPMPQEDYRYKQLLNLMNKGIK